MKNILVPIDFSTFSYAALLTARRIIAKSQGRVICVAVIASEIDWDLLPEEAKAKYPELIKELQNMLRVLPNFIRSAIPLRSHFEQVIKIGVPNEQILRVAEQRDVDMIVMGAHGGGYAEGNSLGSTLQKVVRLACCPVLTVKGPLDGNAFRKIAFATVFNPAGKASFQKILPFAKIFKAAIHLVFVNTPEHFTTSSLSDHDMAEFSKGNEQFVIHRHVFNDHDVECGIRGFCRQNNIRLIAIVTGAHLHAPAYQIGTTETLIFKSDLGVLSVKY